MSETRAPGTLVFVYGTLMKGCSNFHHLKGQRFVGDARTVPGYELRRLSGYPGMIQSDTNTDGVPGEIWAVDNGCLANLHRLEGVDEGLYAFVPIKLQPPYAGIRANTYLYLHGVVGRPLIESRWTE